MLHALLMYLRLRRLNGRTVGVSRPGRDGMIPLRSARVTLLGFGGVGLDGDDIFLPWTGVGHAEWGVGTDRLVARKLAELAKRAAGEDKDEDTDSPLERMLRGMRESRRAREGDAETGSPPKPAPTDEEIAAALAEDEKGLV